MPQNNSSNSNNRTTAPEAGYFLVPQTSILATDTRDNEKLEPGTEVRLCSSHKDALGPLRKNSNSRPSTPPF